MNWFFRDASFDSKDSSRLPEEVKRSINIISDYIHKNENDFTLFYYAQKEKNLSILQNHFYSPVTDVFDLPKSAFEKSSLTGVDQNIDNQLMLARDFFQYKEEYDSYPAEDTGPGRFYYNNPIFVGSDPKLLHCFIRHFRPETVLEVGSGFSTLMMSDAINKNGTGSIIAVEPYPRAFLTEGVPNLKTLIQEKVQDVDLSLFEKLKENDILFIDSSHVLKLGSDVAFLYLEVIPRLKKGVLIHIHDICLPYYYPKEWVFKTPRLWNESHLLQGLLQGNKDLEILFGSFMLGDHLKDKKHLANDLDTGLLGGGSFWMRKK